MLIIYNKILTIPASKKVPKEFDSERYNKKTLFVQKYEKMNLF